MPAAEVNLLRAYFLLIFPQTLAHLSCGPSTEP